MVHSKKIFKKWFKDNPPSWGFYQCIIYRNGFTTGPTSNKNENRDNLFANIIFVVVFQSLSLVWLFATPWTAACQASLSFTTSLNLLKLMSFKSVMPSNRLTLWCPFLLLPSIFPNIKVISSESVLCIRWPKYCSFSISLPMNIQGWFPLGLTGLISLLPKELSRVFSNATVWKHQFIYVFQKRKTFNFMVTQNRKGTH